MTYLDPVVDRTQTDIINRTAKAYFNIADWVRIYGNEQAVNAIEVALNGIGATLYTLSTPTITTIPSVLAINQLIENIELLRAASGLPDVAELETVLVHNYRAGSNAKAPNYEDANAWEAKMEALRAALLRSASYRISAGVAATGQPRFYQSRFRPMPTVP